MTKAIALCNSAAVALVDDADYEYLSAFRWRAITNSRGKLYAARNAGEKITVLMHRELLGLAYGDRRKGDHENGNTLDNRRANLRIATQSQNSANVHTPPKGAVRYRGVSITRGKYIARVRIDGKQTYLGTFSCPIEAAKAYDRAAIDHYGEFARPNFPPGAELEMAA